MKLFTATAQITIVVQAESEFDALLVADEYALEAARDAGLEADWATEIRDITQLPPGWAGTDLPYGGGDDRSIAAILGSMPPVPARDTKTIDMFEVPA